MEDIRVRALPKLCESVLMIAENLGLGISDLSRILDLSTTTIIRMNKCRSMLSWTDPACERAIMLFDFYRLLHRKFKGDTKRMRKWLKERDSDSGKKRMDMLMSPAGIIKLKEKITAGIE